MLVRFKLTALIAPCLGVIVCSQSVAFSSIEFEPWRECVSADNINNTTTPPEHFAKSVACSEQGDYEIAAIHQFIGLVFHSFDKRRVIDETARRSSHDKWENVASNNISDSHQEAYYQYKARNLPNLYPIQDTCAIAIDVGMPSYYPDYMLELGEARQAGMGTEWEVSEGFRPQVEWREVLKSWSCHEVPELAFFFDESTLPDYPVEAVCRTYLPKNPVTRIKRVREWVVPFGREIRFELDRLELQTTMYEIEKGSMIQIVVNHNGIEIQRREALLSINEDEAQRHMDQLNIQHPDSSKIYPTFCHLRN